MGGSPLNPIESEQLFPDITNRDSAEGFDAIPLQDELLEINEDGDNSRSRESSSDAGSVTETRERFRQGNPVGGAGEEQSGFQPYTLHGYPSHLINPKKQKLLGRGFSISANSAFESRFHSRQPPSSQNSTDSSKENAWSSPVSRSTDFQEHTPSETSDDSSTKGGLLWGSLEHLDANWNSPSTSLSVAPGTDTPDISTAGDVTTIGGSSDDDSDIDVVSIVDEDDVGVSGSEKSLAHRSLPSNSESVEILSDENMPGPSGVSRRDSPLQLEVLSSSSDSDSSDDIEVMESSPVEVQTIKMQHKRKSKKPTVFVDLTESDDGM